jgi:iron complex transport system ATP-binding protein
MRKVVDAGYDVSAGVLNALDTDEETGRGLGLRMAVEAPFSPIGDDAHRENLKLIADADVVVVAAVPVSHGNERNIVAAVQAADAGKSVYAAAGLADGDLTGATAGLAAAGARFYDPTDDLLAALEAALAEGGAT